MAVIDISAREVLDRSFQFGEYLVAQGKIAPEATARARQVTSESSERFEIVITRLGLISERELANAFADFLGVPLILADSYPSEPVLEEKLSRKFLQDAKIVPVEDRKDGVVIAMANPLDDYVSEAVRFACQKTAIRCVGYPADIEAAHRRLYGGGKSEIHSLFEAGQDRVDEGIGEEIDRLKDGASDAPVIRLVNLLIVRAVESRASDIHIEPMENELRVRYRVDGVLVPMESPPQRLGSALISRIKLMAKLNIVERRLSQDGRIGMAVRGRDIDIRVSTTPTIHGESVVLRILDRDAINLDFSALGFEDDVALNFRYLIERPHGIVLVTGPTGSGKTTTLYTALQELNTPQKKILTIEDPVEYKLTGINQVQLKPQIGLTFAAALRSFLRQDPDIMMVGEIRDLETAQIAVQAALTGHLILSTLHTNDAASAVTRLLDMGVDDYLITSTINGVVAQRLIRTLCRECRQPYKPLPQVVDKLDVGSFLNHETMTLYNAAGCAHCNNTGYRGRSSIVEILRMTDTLRQAILSRADVAVIQRISLDSGMQTMRAHGFKKAIAGSTTIDEVMRATSSD